MAQWRDHSSRGHADTEHEQDNILSESKGIITEGRRMMRIVEIREITPGRCQGYYRGLEPV